MRIGVISPIDWLPTISHENYHLILVSQVLSSPTYADYYLDRVQEGDIVLLDNDAYEAGQSSPVEDILEAAQRILDVDIKKNYMPKFYVILPDALGDGARTATLILKHHDEIRRAFHPETRFAAVPQGKTVSEWAYTLESIHHMVGEYVSLYCVPRCLENASDFLNPIDAAVQILMDYNVPTHMLGLGNRLQLTH